MTDTSSQPDEQPLNAGNKWHASTDAEWNVGAMRLTAVRIDIPERVEARLRDEMKPAEAKKLMREAHAVGWSMFERAMHDQSVKRAIGYLGGYLLDESIKAQPTDQELLKMLAVLQAMIERPEFTKESKSGPLGLGD